LFFRKFFITVFFLGIFNVSYSQELLWPTDASHLITSTFCEYRPGHFHSGIDIKTWVKTGYGIFAVEDGSVMRIRTSPYGYGKVLYLQLNNDLRAVYAHLSDFSPRIKSIVQKEQERIGRYAIDKRISAGELVVKKGDLLGYTGRSGTDTPHLHFEIRDKKDNPINPFIAGFKIIDFIPPTVKSIAVTPLIFGSHVNGDFVSQIIPVESTGNGRYILADTVYCKGEIGFSISAYDMADGADNKFAPYRLTFYIDNQHIFSTKYDSLTFHNSRQIYLDRDYRLMKHGRGFFHNLYRTYGNNLGFYYFKGKRAGIVCCKDQKLSPNKRITINNDGSVLLSPGIHEIKIIISDFYNNISVVSGLLNNCDISDISQCVSDTTNFCSHTSSYDTSGVYFYREFIQDYLYCCLSTDQPVVGKPIVTVEIEPWKTFTLPMIKSKRGGFNGQLLLDKDYTGILTIKAEILENSIKKIIYTDTVMIHSILPDKPSTLYSLDTVCSINFSDSCLYQSLKGYCEKRKYIHPDCIHGYIYRVFPHTVPLKNPVEIRFNLPLSGNNRDKTAIYSVNKKGYSFVGNNWHTNYISGWSDQLGSFTLLQDTVSPEIDFVSPAPEETITTSFPEIVVGLKDTLSGISGEDSYIIRLNGRRRIVEYDPQKNKCYCPIREPLGNGIHFLEIVVKDRVDNVKKWKGWFRRE